MTTAADLFNRADGALGSDWASFFVGITISSNQALGGLGDAIARWVTTSFAADQWAEATVSNLSVGTNYSGVAVRVDASGNGYAVSGDGSGSLFLIRMTGGAEVPIATITSALVNGDVVRLHATGTTLRVFRNGSQIGTDQTDATYASGQPGLFSFGNGRMDNWSAQDSGGGIAWIVA